MKVLPAGKVRAGQLWASMLTAAIHVGDPGAVLAVLARVNTDVKSSTPTACLRAARFFRDQGDQQKAAELYEAACVDGATNDIVIEYAESLLKIGSMKKLVIH